jgi:hypothetical protein
MVFEPIFVNQPVGNARYLASEGRQPPDDVENQGADAPYGAELCTVI